VASQQTVGAVYSNFFLQEIIAELETVKTKLEAVIEERDKEVSILQADLESEKVARRGLQGTVRELNDAAAMMVICSDYESLFF
jgi:hypothetical protein